MEGLRDIAGVVESAERAGGDKEWYHAPAPPRSIFRTCSQSSTSHSHPSSRRRIFQQTRRKSLALALN